MSNFTIEEKSCLVISRENNGEKSRQYRKWFKQGEYQKILDSCDMTELDSLIRNCVEQGIKIITQCSPKFPERLMRLGQPPYTLFCRGNLELLSKPAVAIIGTRDCTRYGQTVATDLAKNLAKNGIVVVSGLAEGIDTAGHKGAVEAATGITALPKGYEFPEGVRHIRKQPTINTIAVLGNGINVSFPAKNKDLQKQLGEHGLVLSEFTPNTPSAKFTFPWRNRIVAALSSAVIIVEADLKSGTMITRDWALELGVEVFAVPGPITSHASRGTNAIIKEASCSILTNVADVLEIFNVYEKHRNDIMSPGIIQISFEEKTVLDILKADEVHFDELVIATSWPARKLTTLLTSMEINGLLKKLAGNQWIATKGK